jgi:hypothetical protein
MRITDRTIVDPEGVPQVRNEQTQGQLSRTCIVAYVIPASGTVSNSTTDRWSGQCPKGGEGEQETCSLANRRRTAHRNYWGSEQRNECTRRYAIRDCHTNDGT